MIGTPGTVTDFYLFDSGGVNEQDWGFTVYYTNGKLNVVVSNSRYEWRQRFDFGFHQWIFFAMTWRPEIGFEVFLNWKSQGLISTKTKRPNPQNRNDQVNLQMYYGIPSSYTGTLDSVLEPMMIERFIMFDRNVPQIYSISDSGEYNSATIPF